MTYCLAIAVDEGLVLASDSRTNAGADQVAQYSKMHLFGVDGERQIVVLSAGNLATTQAVVGRLKRDIAAEAEESFMSVEHMAAAAEYLGTISRSEEMKHKEAVANAGFDPDATFIVGGQIGAEPPQLFLVYPQGNYITTSQQTPFLQIGETKYGKTILDRMVQHSTSLDAAGRCALISLDSTMRSNATVGPPIELLTYQRDSLTLHNYLCMPAEDPYFLEVKRTWNDAVTRAFSSLPDIPWDTVESKPQCG